MNAKMQTFAQKFTRKGLKTRMITFEHERFDNGGRDIHINRDSQVQRLHVIRKLYKLFKLSLFQIGILQKNFYIFFLRGRISKIFTSLNQK